MTTTTALPCADCGTDTLPGQRTIRTTLGPTGLEPVAWCRTCRPVFVPTQREGR